MCPWGRFNLSTRDPITMLSLIPISSQLWLDSGCLLTSQRNLGPSAPLHADNLIQVLAVDLKQQCNLVPIHLPRTLQY